MVHQGEFEATLVEAVSKTPFKEHQKDGKVYCEVEPDIEYFISIKKTTKSDYPYLYVSFMVDGKNLGYHSQYSGKSVDADPAFRGIWSHVNNVSTDKALKIVKPRITTENSHTGE